jgi:hypothetical protein
VLDALLAPGNPDFVFREPLGQAREVKTAISGLFGRFVARAYATRYLGYSYYQHIHNLPMRLTGPTRGEVRRVTSERGDLPDWAVWGGSSGLGIIEAKGSHAPKGPLAARDRAYKQAERAEIVLSGQMAAFKRYAIATRWGVAMPSPTVPMLAVKDPDVDGKVTPDENRALGLGIVRRHCATILRPFGFSALADALTRLTSEIFRNRQDTALALARAELAQAKTQRVAKVDGPNPFDELLGGFITRNGALDLPLSAPDQETLHRLQMRPTFVGIERRIVEMAIEGRIDELSERSEIATPGSDEHNAAGTWVVRLEAGRKTLG